jgi:murein DD-endopeptidase MepM/ murein hydrolase activator NlpD
MSRLFAIVVAVLLLGAWGLPAPKPSALHLEGDFKQGGLIHGRVPPGSEVSFAGRMLRLSDDGRFVIGFGRNSDSVGTLSVSYPDGTREQRRIEIETRDYRIQRIDGLPPRQVTPSEEDLAQIRRDSRLIGAARRRDTSLPGFAERAIWPVLGPISGVFGSQRILNGEPRSPHRGVDIAAPAGTPVQVMASGVVSLAETGMYFTGGTVMVDHGHGVHSIYVHLSDVRVTTGQRLEQGDTLGTVGATGRATGPHLHWGVYWFERAVDPALLVGPMPETHAARQ